MSNLAERRLLLTRNLILYFHITNNQNERNQNFVYFTKTFYYIVRFLFYQTEYILYAPAHVYNK